jgi:protocatechuate 3,4-dioxygenase beta subunit
MTSRKKIFAAAFIVFFCALSLSAQDKSQDKKHSSQLKTVRGVVQDKSDNPVQSAVVFLKDNHSNQVRSNITNDQGEYRFSGLDPNAEYELYAEKDGTKSQIRNISSFESRTDIVLNLKLQQRKKE